MIKEIKEINEKIFEYLKELNYQKAVFYIDKARKELKLSKDIDKKKIVFLNNAYNIFKVMNSNREYVLQEIAKYFTNIDNEKAEYLFKLALTIDSKNHKPMSLEVGKRFIDLAEFYKKTDRMEEAKIYYDKGILIEKNTNQTGENNYAIPLHSRSLARVYFELNERDNALKLLKKIITWYDDLLNIENDNDNLKKIRKYSAETKLQLSEYLIIMEKLDDAYEILKDLIEWKNENEKSNIIQAMSLMLLGKYFENKEEFENAKENYKKAKDNFLSLAGNYNDEIKILNEKINYCEKKSIKTVKIVDGEKSNKTSGIAKKKPTSKLKTKTVSKIKPKSKKN